MPEFLKRDREGRLMPALGVANADCVLYTIGEHTEREQAMAAAEAAAADARKDAEHYQKLNSALLARNKRDANKDRGLRPKNEHSGYVVKISRSRDFRVSTKDEIRLWETTIQSPHPVRFSAAVIERQIWEDLQRDGDGSGSLLERLGLVMPYDRSCKELTESSEWRGEVEAKEGGFFVARESAEDIDGLIEAILKPDALSDPKNADIIQQLRCDDTELMKFVREWAAKGTAVECVDRILGAGGRARLAYSELNVYFTAWHAYPIADNRAGYWEISITHTKPIGDIPAEMDYEREDDDQESEPEGEENQGQRKQRKGLKIKKARRSLANK